MGKDVYYMNALTESQKILFQDMLEREGARRKKLEEKYPGIGKPKFNYGDYVTFVIDGEKVGGTVEIIDAYGTFEQNEEPSYDIYNKEDNILYKHVRQTGVTYVRKGTDEERLDW